MNPEKKKVESFWYARRKKLNSNTSSSYSAQNGVFWSTETVVVWLDLLRNLVNCQIKWKINRKDWTNPEEKFSTNGQWVENLIEKVLVAQQPANSKRPAVTDELQLRSEQPSSKVKVDILRFSLLKSIVHPFFLQFFFCSRSDLQRAAVSLTHYHPHTSLLLLQQLEWSQQWHRQPRTSARAPHYTVETGRVHRHPQPRSPERARDHITSLHITVLRGPHPGLKWELLLQKQRRVQQPTSCDLAITKYVPLITLANKVR